MIQKKGATTQRESTESNKNTAMEAILNLVHIYSWRPSATTRLKTPIRRPAMARTVEGRSDPARDKPARTPHPVGIYDTNKRSEANLQPQPASIAGLLGTRLPCCIGSSDFLVGTTIQSRCSVVEGGSEMSSRTRTSGGALVSLCVLALRSGQLYNY